MRFGCVETGFDSRRPDKRRLGGTERTSANVHDKRRSTNEDEEMLSVVTRMCLEVLNYDSAKASLDCCLLPIASFSKMTYWVALGQTGIALARMCQTKKQ